MTVWSQPSPIVLKLGKYTWEHMSVNILTEWCDIPLCTPPRPPLMEMLMKRVQQGNGERARAEILRGVAGKVNECAGEFW